MRLFLTQLTIHEDHDKINYTALHLAMQLQGFGRVAELRGGGTVDLLHAQYLSTHEKTDVEVALLADVTARKSTGKEVSVVVAETGQIATRGLKAHVPNIPNFAPLLAPRGFPIGVPLSGGLFGGLLLPRIPSR